MNREMDASSVIEPDATFIPAPMPLALSATLWKCRMATAIVLVTYLLFSGQGNPLNLLWITLLYFVLKFAHSILYGSASARVVFTIFSLIGCGFYLFQFSQLFQSHPNPVSFLREELPWSFTVRTLFESLFFFLATLGFLLPASLAWQGLPPERIPHTIGFRDFLFPPVQVEKNLRKSDILPSPTRHMIRLIYLLWIVACMLFLHAEIEYSREKSQADILDFHLHFLEIQAVDADTGENLDAIVQSTDPRIDALPILFRDAVAPAPEIRQMPGNVSGRTSPDRNTHRLYSRELTSLYIVKSGYETAVIDVDPSNSTKTKIDIQLERVR